MIFLYLCDMRKSFILAAAILGLMSACTKPDQEGQENEGPTHKDNTYTASFETLVKQKWLGGDKISLFAGDQTNQKYLYCGDNAFAVLEDEAPEPLSGKVSACYAVYPYDKSTTIAADGTITLNLPETQTFTRNVVTQHVGTMVAVTKDAKDTELEFKNICGFIKFRAFGFDVIKDLTISGNNGESISGEAKVTARFGTSPTIEMGPSARTSVTIDCGKGAWLGSLPSAATTFWIALPPVNFQGGITIKATSSDGSVFVNKISEPLQVTRNSVSTISKVVEFKQLAASRPLTFVSEGSSTLSLVKNGSPAPVELEYKTTDGWLTYPIGREITLSNGSEVSFRAIEAGNQTFSQGPADFYQFTGSGSLKASGDIMSLVTNDDTVETLPCDYCFFGLFKDFQALKVSPNLGATTLRTGCYEEMFKGCSSLNVIKTSFKTAPGTAFTKDWVAGVAPAGLFHKSPDATWEASGNSSIPDGWNVWMQPDDDDIRVYEAIEYLIPAPHMGANQIASEQSSYEDYTEWTFVSLGRDPYMPMTPLKGQAAGPVIVFQYKSSADAKCEFFWCDGGYGVGGPVGGKETAFTLAESSEWKTFVLDMQDAWTKHGFKGRPGDTIRFDVGNVADLSVSTRLMRWRPPFPEK